MQIAVLNSAFEEVIRIIPLTADINIDCVFIEINSHKHLVIITGAKISNCFV